MKTNIAGSAAIALACWWASPVVQSSGRVASNLVAVPAPAEVEFAVAKKDIGSYWKKTYPTETILEIRSAGQGKSSVKIINLRKVPYYTQPAKVRVKRADGSIATFSISVSYTKPLGRWIFENVGTGNVAEEKAAGQDAPPFAEAEAMIREGFLDKRFQASEIYKDINILNVHPNPAFGSAGKRFWYQYRVDFEGTETFGFNRRKQCKGQQVELVKADAEAPWAFQMALGLGAECTELK